MRWESMVLKKRCTICSREYRSSDKRRKTCGRPVCRTKRKQIVEKKQRAVYRELRFSRKVYERRDIGKKYPCVVCGVTYTCLFERHETCGDWECRKAIKRANAKNMRLDTEAERIKTKTKMIEKEKPDSSK